MRIKVDRDRCQGHNRCVVLAPDLMKADDEGFADVIRPPESEEEVQLARRIVRSCPERALKLAED